MSTDPYKGFGGLLRHPPFAEWDHWMELDPRSWPRRVEKEYSLVPTTCFNCEAGCGLVAFVDNETGAIRKLEGHPLHPGSRGRNCAKGPATVAQVSNPDRILTPLRRVGERGEGRWEPVTWDQALDDIAGRIRAAITEGRQNEVVYHVGRPGEDMYTERMLQVWGIDGHNSHTNVCSAGARTGYMFWMGMDRPNPDLADSRFILMVSSHLEAGHYFNPQAQRIMEAKQKGTKVCVIDTRLSNTASAADYWLSPWPGTEAGLFLSMARELLVTGQYNRRFLRRWVNWREFLADDAYLARLVQDGFIAQVPEGKTFEAFESVLKEMYGHYTPEWAEQETGVPAATVRVIAGEIARAGTAFSSNIWRSAAASHRGGWMVARALNFLNVLMGALGTKGSMVPSSYTKFVAKPPTHPHPIKVWNETNWPKEFPLANFEMSFCLPHILAETGRTIDTYFTRVYNPVWTNPDGFSWIEMLQTPGRIGLHIALTPTWSETAQFADYVLPMGLAPERHDLVSYETHPSQWIAWRQPVHRALAERRGEAFTDTRDTNPGQVWEENEFWIELTWRIDPDGRLGMREHFESPYRPGEKVRIDEYYRWIFENSIPGLPAAAQQAGESPYDYMRKRATFEITTDVYEEYERPVPPELMAGTVVDAESGGIYAETPPPKVNYRPWPGPFEDKDGRVRIGIERKGEAKQGFPTPSGLLEFFSTTLRDWGWPEYAVPIYPRNQAERQRMVHITSQVHRDFVDTAKNEFPLLPNFRLPTLIHTRTNGAKWLYEISQNNPIWVHPQDAARLGVKTGDLVKMSTEIGHIVDRCWVTEAIRPGVIACSHHLGRWRQQEDHGSDRWNSALVRLEQHGTTWRMKQLAGVTPFASSDPDSSRIYWHEAGVHQNITFPVQPDPISGQHCWQQKITLVKAGHDDHYGDIAVDTGKARAAYKRWLELCRPAPGPDGTRRPYWLLRPLKPHPDAYKL